MRAQTKEHARRHTPRATTWHARSTSFSPPSLPRWAYLRLSSVPYLVVSHGADTHARSTPARLHGRTYTTLAAHTTQKIYWHARTHMHKYPMI
ncbi:MAG: hypothetical protein ACK55Z_23300 [bacterium]